MLYLGNYFPTLFLMIFNQFLISFYRSWQTRSFVQAVRLIVIDEIHLLGEDRGPVLEVIVSRYVFCSLFDPF